MRVDNNRTRFNFQGDISKRVQKIFYNMKKDIDPERLPYFGLESVDSLNDTLERFVSQTDPSIVFDYKSRNLWGNYGYFFFKNTNTGKVLPASSKKVMAIINKPIEENGRLFLKPPKCDPDDRLVIENYNNEYLNKKIREYEEIDILSAYPFTIIFSNHLVLALALRCYRGFRSLFPKIKIEGYDINNLISLSDYINELTTKYKPKDINELLS